MGSSNKKTLNDDSSKIGFGIIKRTGRLLTIVIGLIAGLIILAIVAVLIGQTLLSVSQNKKFTTAQEKCQTEPVVVVRSYTSLLGGSTSYNLYAPSNPEYQKMKTLVPGFLNLGGETKVYGYYCSIEEAEKEYLPRVGGGSVELSDSESNYVAEKQQYLKDTYLEAQKSQGIKFYSPANALKGFKINAKSLTPETNRYNIGYIGDTPETKGRGEVEPINLICYQIYGDKPIGVKVASNHYGGDVYVEEDQYHLNIRSYLPGTTCTLEAPTGQVSTDDGIALVISIVEVDSSMIANYDLNLF